MLGIVIAISDGFFTNSEQSNFDSSLGGEEETPVDQLSEDSETNLETEVEEEPEENEAIIEDVDFENVIDENEEQESQLPEESEEENEGEFEPEESSGDDPSLSEEELTEEQVQEEPVEEPIEEEPYVEPEVTITVSSENESIYKGYLYANATSSLRYATDYNTIDTLEIVGGKNISRITVQDEPDKMQVITNTKIGLMNQIYYRKTRVSVNEFASILGREGKIVVYSLENEPLGFIDINSEIENNEYVFVYSEQYDSVRFELIGIIGDGFLSIKNDKSIKESTEFSRNQISLFSSINTIASLNVYVGEEIKGTSSEGNITLEETESRMEIGLDTEVLSVEGKNEVAINITLRTDEEKYDLFENPRIDLEFPSQIETVDVTGMMLLYKNGLSIENWEVITNAVGRKVLRINLSGAQLEYTPGAVQEGTTIVAYTEIDVNRLTADTSENLKMTFTNKDTIRKSYSLEGKDSEDVLLSFVGRQELVRAMEITDAEGNKATSYDEQTEKIQLKPNQEQRLTITSTIVNNFETTLTNVEIIGRLPFTGNKDENGNDLGTNFEATLENAIATNGVVADIYYSEDGAAERTSDSWKIEVEDFSQIKSYKIVLREGSLAKGEKLGFEYSLLIPESVGYNAKAYTCYTVYYTIDTQEYKNLCSCGMYTEEKEVELEDISEEEKKDLAELTIGTQVSQGGTVLGEFDTVYERQVLRYTVVVKNTSNITAQNVVLKCNAENANLYYFKTFIEEDYYGKDEYEVAQWTEDVDNEKGYEEFVIEKLEPGESQTFSYQVIAHEVDGENNDIYGVIKVSADNILEQTIETLKFELEEAKLETRISYSGTEAIDGGEIRTNAPFRFCAYVKNISGEELNDIIINVNIPEEIEFTRDSLVTSYEEILDDEVEDGAEIEEKQLDKEVSTQGDNTIASFHIAHFKVGESRQIHLVAHTKELDLNVVSKKIIITGYAEVDGNRYNANDYQKKINQGMTALEYSFKGDVDENTILKNNDEITYTLGLKNIGHIEAGAVLAQGEIPKGVEVEEIKLIKANGDTEILEKSTSNNMIMTAPIDTDEEIRFEIKTKINENLFDRDQSKVETQMHISGATIKEFDTNVVSYKIENYNVTRYLEPLENVDEPVDNGNEVNNYNDSNDSNDNTTPQQVTETYVIKGRAWLDSNQDGIRQFAENPVEAVIVYLYKANSNGGLNVSNLLQTTATMSNGEYTLNNVEPGNYIVVFDYNSTTYKVTKYQVANAKMTENSDAISKKVTMSGESRILGVTDVITISNGSVAAIDIGLVDKTNFDLSLTKEISKVVVKNSSGTKAYTFKDGENARLEINSKYYKSSVLDITYNFKVTNEGDVTGYVNKVLDYLPDDVEVVLNSSPGWYIGNDNGLYYTGLVDQEINAGETREFALVVRKSLANGEAVKLTNSSEIIEYTNKLGLYDRDSIENNKEKMEDDFGTAILTVSISTGNTGQVVFEVLIIIIMIATISMIIIKLKNTKKIYR